jgi:putative restriction endonuclease
MREVSPGDVVFSFVDTRIVAIGTAQTYCYESPKPTEFGEAGLNWEAIGWRIRVSFTPLPRQVRPKDHMQVLRDLLPDRYSPLQPNGNEIQSIYLTEVPELFGRVRLRYRPRRTSSLKRQKFSSISLRKNSGALTIEIGIDVYSTF